MWQDIRSGIRRFTVLAAGVLLAMACLAGTAKTYAQTAVDDSVLLDPFDPVPQIGFHHGEYGDCYDPCGNHHCYRNCGYHRHAGCEHDCRRPCEHGCEPDALDRYNRQADMWAVLANIYMDEMNWYEEHYRGGAHHYSLRDDDHHDGDDRHDGRDGDRHDGAHDGHDGDRHDGDDRHDAHDGDHHDGDHDGRDGDHHDGGDGHDGDHHGDRDRHDDGDHHDGQWQDGDGNWHDGPPPNGYGH